MKIRQCFLELQLKMSGMFLDLGPPFRGIIVIITLTLTPGSPEWRTSGMAALAGRYRFLRHSVVPFLNPI